MDHLQFHLYLNAFKNERSLYMIEEGGHHGTFSMTDSSEWGWIDMVDIRLADGNRLSWSFVPFPDAPEDETVIQVDLPFAVKPGDSLVIDYRFISKLPRLVARTGYGDDRFFMVGQWFPKIGVWEKGGWNCHPFHAYSEFYSDFGVYDLELHVPKGFVVAANGMLTGQETRGDTVVYRYRQEDVIDAVWTAYPFYTVDSQAVRSGMNEVKVNYLLAPGREENVPRYRRVAPAMFEYMADWMGTYPYPNFTIVDVPKGEVTSAGGMEYPTLITTGTLPETGLVEWLEPLRWLEIVTFHEFAHQYCQSMIASNEFEEPWLDEGLTSYLEHRMLEEYARRVEPGPSMGYLFGLPIQSLDYHRNSYLRNPRHGKVVARVWEIPRRQYQTMVYSKPVLIMITLERMLGRETMDRILKTYFERWKFRHPTTGDFLDVVSDVSGRDLAWFFDAFLYGSSVVDHEVVSIRAVSQSGTTGWFGSGRDKTYRTGASEVDTVVSRVTVRNNGDIAFPTTIVVIFADGDSILQAWTGEPGTTEFEFRHRDKVVSVHADPHQINVLDLDLSNNSRYTEPETTGVWGLTVRFLSILQNLILNLLIFV